MSKRKESHGICRRSFIKTSGMVTGAAAVYPLQAHVRVFFNNHSDITVRLLPRGQALPLISAKILLRVYEIPRPGIH